MLVEFVLWLDGVKVDVDGLVSVEEVLLLESKVVLGVEKVDLIGAIELVSVEELLRFENIVVLGVVSEDMIHSHCVTLNNGRIAIHINYQSWKSVAFSVN